MKTAKMLARLPHQWRVLGRLAQRAPSRRRLPRPYTKKELDKLQGKDYPKFFMMLPYRYFDEKTQLFINAHSVGFGLELAPFSGANEATVQAVSQLLINKIDQSLHVEVVLLGSHQVEPILSAGIPKQAEQAPVLAALAKSQYDYFLRAAKQGVPNKQDLSLPLRNYRCFLFASRRSGYTPEIGAQMAGRLEDISSELRNIGLQNRPFSDADLVGLIQSILGGDRFDGFRDFAKNPDPRRQSYNELNRQAVPRNLDLRVEPNHLGICTALKGAKDPGSEHTRLVSLGFRQLPESLMLWQQPDCFSNILKPSLGIPCAFLISINFKLEDATSSKLKALGKASSYEKKANSPYANLLPGTIESAQDWRRVQMDLSADLIRLCEIHFNCLLFSTPQTERDDVAKTEAAYAANGMELFRVQYQQLNNFLAALPFVCEEGLWQDLRLFCLTDKMTSWNLANLLPLVAEYKGVGSGGVFAPTFRHQAARIDNFAPNLDNYNICISATSGSGKSVLCQTLIASILGEGGKAWVIDLGGSYKKFCAMVGGTYLDVSNLRLNPFCTAREGGQSAESIRDLIALMASPNQTLGDVEKAHLLNAVVDAYEKKGRGATIDDVTAALGKIEPDERIDDLIILLGRYSTASANALAAQIFNGASALAPENAQKERFIVLELGELANQPDLLKVVLFALILHVESEMYGDQRNRKKICVIDEAWRLLSGSNKTAAAFIERGFRTARKHRGAFVTITQQINDFYASSEAKAVWNCAENKIIMRQNEKGFKDFLAQHPNYFSGYEAQLIQNFGASAANGFSEFLIQQGSVSSFHRLFLDPFAQIMYSSKAEEQEAVDTLVSRGYSLVEAIQAVANTLFEEEKLS